MPPPLLKIEILLVRSRRVPEEDGVGGKIQSTVEGEAIVESIGGATKNRRLQTGKNDTWNGAVAREHAACVYELLWTFAEDAFEDVVRAKAAMMRVSLTARPEWDAESQPVALRYETDLVAWAVAPSAGTPQRTVY